MKIVDADSHFIEPFNLFEKYIEPEFRERAMHLEKDPAGGALPVLVVDHKQMVGMDFDNGEGEPANDFQIFSDIFTHGTDSLPRPTQRVAKCGRKSSSFQRFGVEFQSLRPPEPS